jgi:hypothetical protein
MNFLVVELDCTRLFRACRWLVGWESSSTASTADARVTKQSTRRNRLPMVAITNVSLLTLCACCGPPALGSDGRSGAAEMTAANPSWPTQQPPVLLSSGAHKSEFENLGDLAQALVQYHDSGAYDRDLQSIVGEAISYVSTRSSTARRPALVLDIDETALSNWEQLKANGFAYFGNAPCVGIHPLTGPCGSKCWDLNATTPAGQAVLRLYQVAIARHVAVFFITGRHEEERAATEENLRLVGYKSWKTLYMKPKQSDMPTSDYCRGKPAPSNQQVPPPVVARADTPGVPVAPELSAADFKAPRRQEIMEQGYTIVANVGDQPSDLEGGFAERTYLLPNPFYRIN